MVDSAISGSQWADRDPFVITSGPAPVPGGLLTMCIILMFVAIDILKE